jgi:hypothetical protein
MKIKLSNVRLSFPDLFEAREYQGDGNFKYAATFLVTPGSTEDALIKAAIQEVALDVYAKKAPQMLASFAGSKQQMCYLSGDTKVYDGYQGMMALSSKRKQADGRPGVFDRNLSPIAEADGKIYGGCYVNAMVDLWAQSGTTPGIRCSLISVQFFRDGDAFGGSSAPTTDDFEAYEDGADAEMLV